MGLNHGILYFFNGMATKSALLDGLAKFFVQGSAFVVAAAVLAFYIAGFILKKERLRAGAANAVCIVAICLLAGLAIEQFVHEARPMFALGGVTPLLPHADDSSFPSDHMLLCFGAAFGLYPIGKKTGFALMAFGLLTGVAKVYAGQHYPLDIILTILIALAISVLYLLLVSKWAGRLYIAIERRVLPQLHR